MTPFKNTLVVVSQAITHPHTGFSSAAGGSSAGAERSSTDFSSSAMREAIASRSAACSAMRASASAARASAAAASAFFFRREPFRLSFGLLGVAASPSTFFFFFDLRRFGLGFSGRSAGSASPSKAMSSPGAGIVGEAASLAVTRSAAADVSSRDAWTSAATSSIVGPLGTAASSAGASSAGASSASGGAGAAAPPNILLIPLKSLSSRMPQLYEQPGSTSPQSISCICSTAALAAWLVASAASRSTGPAASAALPAYSTVASAASRITGPATVEYAGK